MGPDGRPFVILLALVFFICVSLCCSVVSLDAHDVSFSSLSSAESCPEERQGYWASRGNPGELVWGGLWQSEQPPSALSHRR